MTKINPQRFTVLDADDGQTLGEVGSVNGITIGRGAGERLRNRHQRHALVCQAFIC